MKQKKKEIKIATSSFEINKLITTSRMYSKINLMLSSRLVLRCIVDFWNPSLGYAYPTQKTIALCTGLSEVSVGEAVKELALKQILKKQKINKRIHYKLTVTFLGYLNLIPQVSLGDIQSNLGNITQEPLDNNIIINNKNTSFQNSLFEDSEVSEKERAEIMINKLKDSDVFKKIISGLKDKHNL